MVQPPLSPEDKPTRDELARLAGRLLDEMSAHDTRLAERMRRLGLEPGPERRSFKD